MKIIDITDEKITLEELLRIVETGTEVTLISGEKPVAQLLPVITPDMPRIFNLHPGAFEISDDFDDELPDTFWLGTDEVSS